MDFSHLPNFADPHVHVKSFDAASTPEKFAQRELEMGGKYLTITDHGTLEGIRDLYTLTTKSKKFGGQLKIIPGLEAYFRDDDCPVLLAAGATKNAKGTLGDWIKYFHLTMHFQDQEAFETASRLLSRADLRAEVHGSERKPLFNWADLEELGSKNITFGSSCLIGMVSRHLLTQDDATGARAYYERLRSIVKPGNFVVELFPHQCGTNWVEGVFFTFEDGTEAKYYEGKTLRTADGDIKAGELAKQFARDSKKAQEKHQRLIAVKHYHTWTEETTPKVFLTVEYVAGEVANECRPWCPNGDVQLGCNNFLLEMADKYKDPVILSSDSHFAYPDEKMVQDIRLGMGFRFVNSHHKLTNNDAWAYCKDVLGMGPGEFQRCIENSYRWASGFDNFQLKPKDPLPTDFYPKDTLEHLRTLINKYGRMNWNDPVMRSRLKQEVELLHKNGTIDLLPYFFVCEDAISAHLRAGIPVGPGRGSAAGVLMAYLLGITHANPLDYDLSLDRFLTLDRIKTGKMPDIDMDFPNRDFLVDPQDSTKGWLKERFGDRVAQISTDGTIKLKSAILDTFRVMHGGTIPPEVATFSHNLMDPPQGLDSRSYVFGYADNGAWVPGLFETDSRLREFSEKWPVEWETITMLLGLYRQKGRHASAFIINNEPIENFIPLVTIGNGRATQFTANAVEASGALKFDFLGVAAIGDIERATRLIRARHMVAYDVQTIDGIRYVTLKSGKRVAEVDVVPLNGDLLDVYDLPVDDAVYQDIVDCKTETVFQLDTHTARTWLRRFRFRKPDGTLGLNSINDLATFTALDRPGGLDSYVVGPDGKRHNMMVEYARRSEGLEPIDAMDILLELAPKTHGIMCFQEDLQRVFQIVAGVSGVDANNFRGDVSKKQKEKVIGWKAKFMAGAIPRIGEAEGEKLWENMVAWANYGFNKSHAVSYMLTGYATAWLKHHYPLEWWTAVLQGADSDEVFGKFWPSCGHLIDFPDVRQTDADFAIRGDRIQAPLRVLKGVGEKASAELALVQAGPAFTNIEEFCNAVQTLRVAEGRGTPAVNKKGQPYIKPGRTALHSGVIGSLILSGAMDSLFPTEADPSEKLGMWEEAWKDLGNKLKTKPREPVGKLRQYQLRKDVLPGYCEDLFNVAWNRVPDEDKGVTDSGLPYVKAPHPDSGLEEAPWAMSDKDDLADFIAEKRPEGFRMAAAAYVLDERRFEFKSKQTGSQLPACQLDLEVGGEIIKVVRWPKNDDKLPAAFKNPLKGAVVLALLQMTKDEERPLKLINIRVLERPLGQEEKEESAE